MNPETVIAILAFLTGVTFIASFVAAMEDRASLSIICGSLAILFSSSMWHKVADLQPDCITKRQKVLLCEDEGHTTGRSNLGLEQDY